MVFASVAFALFAGLTEAGTPGGPDVSTNSVPIDRARGRELKYVLYVPRAYDPSRAWPLILFLHGSGEKRPIRQSIAP